MAKTLTDFLKSSSKDKVAIGYADLKGYQAALDAMRLQYDEEFIEGGAVELSDIINQASDVTLSGSVDQQGFIDDQSLKQMYMDVGFFGGCPMAGSDNENFMGAPPGSTSGVFAGGTCTPNSDDKFCPVGTQESLFADGGDYKVGVFFDVEGKGTQYIEKFYPDSDLKATYTPNNPSLSELIQNGMLWVEIAFPASDNAGETQGKVMVAKVIGNARSSGVDNTIYINAPLALHSNFSSVFSCQEGKSLYNEQYDSMQGGISGFGPASVKEKFSQNGGVKDIHIQSVQHCRVRLWVSKDMGTAEVPEEMYDRNYKQSPVNQVQSTTTGTVVGAPSTQITGEWQGVNGRVSEDEIQTGKSKFGPHGAPGLMTSIQTPYPLKIGKKTVNSISVHTYAAEALKLALTEVLAVYGLERIRQLGLDIYDGCMCDRLMRGSSTKYSIHSWGIAIDFYAAKNGMKQSKPSALFSGPEYEQFIDIMQKYGWMSLGRWRDYDWMHFQWCTFSRPQKGNGMPSSSTSQAATKLLAGYKGK